jgi:hypothetical protein
MLNGTVVLKVHPLPQERENRSQSHGLSCDCICRMFSRESQSVRLLFSLPGGEGQGEGERYY